LVAKVFSPNGVDIGRRLASAGWALAYRRYSKDYVDAEDEARKARRGMWRGSFVKPWVWRASSPPRGHAGTFDDRRDVRRQAGDRQEPVDVDGGPRPPG
jgi:endonuclease YncB( thermonuclease family)